MASQPFTAFGKTQTGWGTQIPFDASGNVDINALVGGMTDRNKRYYFDTLKVASGATVINQYNFFANQKGVADPNNPTGGPKTYVETNMVKANELSAPYDMVIYNLGFYFSPDVTLYDQEQILKFGYFEFKIMEKTYHLGHLWRHPSGAGVSGATSQANESAWQNGIVQPQSIYFFDKFAKYLPPAVNFSLTLNFPETVTQAVGTTLGALNTLYGQVGASLPTLRTAAQGGNGLWLVAFMNGVGNGPVQ